MNIRFFVIPFTILAVSSANASDDTKVRLAVLDLKPTDVSPATAENLTDVLIGELAATGAFTVTDRKTVQALLVKASAQEQLGCDDTQCWIELAGALNARYLVTGTVGQLGETMVLSAQLIDAKRAEVIGRATDQVKGGFDAVLLRVRLLAARIAEPLLKDYSGNLLVEVDEPGAEIRLDDRLLASSPMRATKVTAGRHEVRISRTGFLDWSKEVSIEPGQTRVVDARMVPSLEFIEEYENENSAKRTAAWITLAGGIGLGAFSVGFLAYGDQEFKDIDRQRKQLIEDRQEGRITSAEYRSRFDDLADDKKRIENLDTAAIILGIVGAVSLGSSIYLWLVGDNPDRYDRFRPTEPKVAVQPLPGGGAALLLGGSL